MNNIICRVLSAEGRGSACGRFNVPPVRLTCYATQLGVFYRGVLVHLKILPEMWEHSVYHPSVHVVEKVHYREARDENARRQRDAFPCPRIIATTTTYLLQQPHRTESSPPSKSTHATSAWPPRRTERLERRRGAFNLRSETSSETGHPF